MKLWDKFKRIFQSSSNSDGNWTGPHFNFTSWASSIFGGTSNNSLATNETIFSVVTRLSNTMASLPLHEYQSYKQVTDGLALLLDNGEANQNMSSFELINRLETSRNTNGNGYAWIQRDTFGEPIALWPIRPESVSPEINTDDNSLWYIVTDQYFKFVVYNTEMIHVKQISPLGMVKGLSPIAVLKNTLDYAQAVETFSLSEMSKKDAYIISRDKTTNDKKALEAVQAFLQMVKNNGGAAMLDPGMTVERYESKFQPNDLQTSEKITNKRIANAFNVPINFLNESVSSGALSTEDVMTQYVQTTILPIIKQYEAEFNRKLLTQSQRAKGFYFKFNVNGLMRGNMQARATFYQIMIRNSAFTPNDIRRLEDLPPSSDPNADELMVSGDLYPLDTPIADRKSSSSKGGDSNETKISNN